MFKEYFKYIKDNPKGYWFKAKWYGWGWTPATWQGWLITAIYILLIISFSLTIDNNSPVREVFYTFILPVLFLTSTFIAIAYKTGEKPSWHWGNPSTTKPNNIALTLFIIGIMLFGYGLSSYINSKSPVASPEPIISQDTKTYHDDTFDVTYFYPKDWFGPEIYKNETGFRFEIGTDTVYPYGTDRTEQIYSKENSYYIIAQYEKYLGENNYALTQYKLIKALNTGESLSNMRSLTIKVRDIDTADIKGVEYITTLSETAQTEHFYSREIILINNNNDSVVIRGTANNVVVEDKSNWRKYFEEIDAMYLETFTDFASSALL